MNPNAPPGTTLDTETQTWLYENFVSLMQGVRINGTFTTTDGKTVTVKNGIVVSITP